MTLYTFDKDAGGKSACNGPCATNWPPLMASADAKPAGSYTVIARDDGGKQWAYKGKPLYAWNKDQKPGDVTGDGFLNGAWHIAQLRRSILCKGDSRERHRYDSHNGANPYGCNFRE
jgi:predicted lipoprotein with Yx(FWY)xxD motif